MTSESFLICVLSAHTFSTLFLTGLIWTVQVVHYPLMADVGSSEFCGYANRHTRLITGIVAPLMCVEAFSAFILWWQYPGAAPLWMLETGLWCLVLIWVSTALIQVPCHRKLSAGFDSKVHRHLVRTNWSRTILWTVRGVLAVLIANHVNAALNSRGEISMGRLKPGDPAPDFTATAHTGEQIRLADYRGRRGLVLFFYPKDGTAVCTKEACAFRDSYMKFVDAGAEVIGISSDGDASHQDFARQNRLTFPLISDADGSLRRLYQVPRTFGVIPGRVTYVIDGNGVIRRIFSAQLASDAHVVEALAALEIASE